MEILYIYIQFPLSYSKLLVGRASKELYDAATHYNYVYIDLRIKEFQQYFKT